MLRISLIATVIVCVFALTASAAGIDGKWLSERTMERQGKTMTLTTTLELKSSGNALTGTMASVTPRGERSVEIQNGKVDGDNFSFTVVQKGRDGETTVTYEGSVSGDDMTATQKREGSDQARPFTAKRQ